MPTSTLEPTPKGEMPKGKRQVAPIRLLDHEHAELKQASEHEQRSMSFIAYRRYQAGLRLEEEQL